MFHPLGNQSYRQGYRHGSKTFYSPSHLGVDWILPTGKNLYAPEDGRITRQYWGQGGNVLVLETDAYVHRFMHLSKYTMKTGDTVKKGDLIGITGNTGMSTAPHLHWDLWDKKNGNFNLNNFNGFKDPQSLELLTELIPMDLFSLRQQVADLYYTVFRVRPNAHHVFYEARKAQERKSFNPLIEAYKKNREAYLHNTFRADVYCDNHKDVRDALGIKSPANAIDRREEVFAHFYHNGMKTNENRTDTVKW